MLFTDGGEERAQEIFHKYNEDKKVSALWKILLYKIRQYKEEHLNMEVKAFFGICVKYFLKCTCIEP